MSGNGRKQTAVWLVFVQGILAALGIYLLAAVLAALLAVRAVLPEAGVLPMLAAGSFLAVCAGGLLCARRSGWGSLPSALVCAGGFLAVLIAVALLCWEEAAWLGGGGLLLLCAAAGGIAAGLLGGRRRRRGGKRVRSARKAEKVRL